MRGIITLKWHTWNAFLSTSLSGKHRWKPWWLKYNNVKIRQREGSSWVQTVWNAAKLWSALFPLPSLPEESLFHTLSFFSVFSCVTFFSVFHHFASSLPSVCCTFISCAVSSSSPPIAACVSHYLLTVYHCWGTSWCWIISDVSLPLPLFPSLGLTYFFQQRKSGKSVECKVNVFCWSHPRKMQFFKPWSTSIEECVYFNFLWMAWYYTSVLFFLFLWFCDTWKLLLWIYLKLICLTLLRPNH